MGPPDVTSTSPSLGVSSTEAGGVCGGRHAGNTGQPGASSCGTRWDTPGPSPRGGSTSQRSGSSVLYSVDPSQGLPAPSMSGGKA